MRSAPESTRHIPETPPDASRFTSGSGLLLVDVPRLMEEGVVPTAKIHRSGEVEPGETLFVETGNPLRIIHEKQTVRTLILDLRGSIDILLTIDKRDRAPRLVRPASLTIHLRQGDSDPPATKDSVAPQLCVRRTMSSFIRATISEASLLLKAIIGLIGIGGVGGSAALLVFGERAFGLLLAAVVLAVLTVFACFVIVSWVRAKSEVNRWLMKT